MKYIIDGKINNNYNSELTTNIVKNIDSISNMFRNNENN